MRCKVIKVGESMAIVLPDGFAEEFRVEVGSHVDVRIEVPSPKAGASKCPRYGLEQLLSEMPEPAPMVPGWDSMPARGREE